MPSNDEPPRDEPRAPTRWTLRAKWTLALLGVAMAPMTALGVLVLAIQREGLSRAEKELEAAVVDEAAAGVMREIDRAADVTARARRVLADDALDVDARMRALADLAGATPSIAGIAFFDTERRFVDAVVPVGSRPDPPSAADGTLAAPPEGTEGFRLTTTPSGAPVLRYEAPLEGALPGFVVVAIDREALDAQLAAISQVRFGAKERVYLVDEAMRIVAGRRAPAPLPIFETVGWRGHGFATPVLVTSEFRDGVDKVGTIRTMPAQRMALVVERPTDEAFTALASARRAFLFVLAGAAALAALAGVLVVRRVLGPIRTLMGLVRRYGRRDFRARSDVRSGDELEALGSSLERMADELAASEEEIAKRARIEANLRRYMPEEAAEVAVEGGDLDLGGARRRVTVLFADVVAFTGFAERTSPERAVAFLNELFTMLSEIVFRHGGMVDKFIGDCVMAVFRPATPDEHDDVARALAAATDMHAFVESNLPRWREAYAFDVELGIGVSTGEVLMGNLGSSTRMEYTVIGDAVNVAARLEMLARPRQTLATREVVDACPEVQFAPLGSHALRGKTRPVEVFEVVQ